MIFLVCILFVLGVFAASAFAIGKFNQLVTLRHRISTRMLQFDFALRNQSAEIRTMVNDPAWLKAADLPPAGFFSWLARAEESAHRAVSGRLCDGNLAELAAADELIASCWNILLVDARDDLARLARCHLVSNAEARGKIAGLVVHYSHLARSISCRWIARASGFESLTATDCLSEKILPLDRSAP